MLGAAPLAAIPVSVAPPSPVLLAVQVNGESVGEFVPLLHDGTRYYARATDLQRWRLSAAGESRRDGNDTYHALPPATTRLDAASQTLHLVAPAAAFTAQHIDLDPASPALPETPAMPGLILDYDFNLQTGAGRPLAAALLDLGVFGVPGVAGTWRHRGVLRNAETGPLGLRLETQWRLDEPAELRSWSVGDSVTCSGEFGGAARYAGVQVATDFGLRPDLVTYPLPTLAGSAALPSAIDLLVDGRAAGSVRVGSGPFQLDNPPLVSGAGEISVIQQDVLGRATRINVPYYLSPRLLRPGLSDTCFEVGRLRRNYGLISNDYGMFFSAAGARFGVSPTLTLLGRAEISDISSVQFGANWVASGLGVVTAQAAASHGEIGEGAYGQLRFERQSRRLSLGAGVEAASESFRRLSGDRLPEWRASLAGGVPLGRASVSFAAVWQRDRQATTRLASASVASRLTHDWHGQFTLQTRNGEWMGFATLARQFGESGSLALAAQASAGDVLGTAQAQKGEPLAGGLGWQVFASSGRSARQQAGVSWLGQAGRVQAEVARDDRSRALRLGGRGGLLWVGGLPGVSRGLGEGAMARVSVPGLAGVSVLHQNRVVAVTDAHGDAWVPGLLPHQANTLAIDPLALPLAVGLDRDSVLVRPPARAAIAVIFPVRQSRAALVRVVDESGVPVPPGGQARLMQPVVAERADQSGFGPSPFGMGGEVFLDRLAAQNQMEVRWSGKACRVDFALPASDDPQPRIGPLVCDTRIKTAGIGHD